MLTPVEVRRIHRIIVEVLKVTMPPESSSEAPAAIVPRSGPDRNREGERLDGSDDGVPSLRDLNVSWRRG